MVEHCAVFHRQHKTGCHTHVVRSVLILCRLLVLGLNHRRGHIVQLYGAAQVVLIALVTPFLPMYVASS